MTDLILNLGEDAHVDPAFERRSTDPTILPQPYSTPSDFTAQYPQPLDPTEILAMCEEITLWSRLPDHGTALNAEYWREMSTLEFVSGSSYIAFADGECPEYFQSGGNNITINIKNIGAKDTLSLRDISHSVAVATGYGDGINRIVGGFPSGEGKPGGNDMATFAAERIAGIKEKRIRTGMSLVMNGWDRLLVQGDTNTNSLEFDGIENYSDNVSNCTIRSNDNSGSGSFSAISYDRYLAEGCATPTLVAGHPAAIQELMSAYFQLGFQGSQVVNFQGGDRITPGFNFSDFVNTGVGRLQVLADRNFRRNASGAGAFQADLWAFRMTHNGEDLVYKINQFPLSLNDLTPGCTAISFQVWAATALVIKACCAHSKYTSQFTGRIVTTCPTVG